MSRPSTLRTLRASLPGPSCTRSISLPTQIRSRSTSPWPSKSHLRPPPSIPAPVPALYPHTVILSDGSTFTAHLTNPSPATIRLTRDVTNNPLWAPGTEKRGLGDGEAEGRVGRFRKRFEGLQDAAQDEAGDGAALQGESGEGAQAGTVKRAFAESDLDWMSEGAVEEKAVKKEAPVAVKGKGKKK